MIEPQESGRTRVRCMVCSPPHGSNAIELTRRIGQVPSGRRTVPDDVHTPRPGYLPVDEPPPEVRGTPGWTGEPNWGGPQHPGMDGPLYRAHLTALKALGIADKPDGLLVLNLARRVDEGEAGAAHAAMAARLMLASERAYAGAPPSVDAVDELMARRAARAGEGA
jgi:hypothetical protein